MNRQIVFFVGRSTERPFFVSGLIMAGLHERVNMLISRGTNGKNSTQAHSWGYSPAAGRHDRLWHRFHRDRERRARRRKTIVKRRDNGARFERTLLPALSALFGNMFNEHPDQDDAVQDCLCQAWLAYCGLSDHAADVVTAGQLAARVYR